MGDSWNDFRKTFPWRAMTVGFLIPKVLFFIGISLNMLFAGAALAVGWCLAVFLVTRFYDRKANIFTVAAALMIILRVAVVLASKSPTLYLIAQAFDSAVCGVVFFASLFFPRSLIQLFAEASGVSMPDEVRASPYYVKAWRIITIVWSAAYLALAVILIMLNLGNLKAAAIVDIVAGWPFMIIMIAFTVIFPRWYWTKNIGASALEKIP